jgi:hypothetical protein
MDLRSRQLTSSAEHRLDDDDDDDDDAIYPNLERSRTRSGKISKERPSYLTLNELRKAHRNFFIRTPTEEINYTPIMSTNQSIVRGIVKVPFTDYYLRRLFDLLTNFHEKLLLEYTPKQLYTVSICI